jgi:NADPH:quinone reductase-like Zn-dependent oxidoreductase
VIPLAIMTAAVGLFPEDQLNLPFPSSKPSPQNTVLIWGGSGSVGTFAVQLARASGAYVIATASKKNHEYVLSLGADEVFDYKSPTVVDDIVNAIKTKGVQSFIGSYDTISSPETVLANAEIVKRTKGVGKVVATLPTPDSGLPDGVTVTVIFAGTLLFKDKALAHKLFKEWLPKALEDGTIKPKPDPEVVGKGLEAVDKAMDLGRKGVSAKKIVVSLE